MADRGLKTQKGPSKLVNQEHVDCALAKATIDVLAPGEVLTDDFAAAWEVVGKGCLVRVELSAETFIAFASDAAGKGVSTGAAAVTVSSTPAIQLPAGYHILRATGAFMRASTNPDRVEVLF